MPNPDQVNLLKPLDVAELPFEYVHIPFTGADIAMKMLHADAETGMTVQLVKYPAGFTNVWHKHPCGHGMFVLEGTLRTHQGDYPQGTFVWFEEGGYMEHGATESEDVSVLFVTNKQFGICYYGEDCSDVT